MVFASNSFEKDKKKRVGTDVVVNNKNKTKRSEIITTWRGGGGSCCCLDVSVYRVWALSLLLFYHDGVSPRRRERGRHVYI